MRISVIVSSTRGVSKNTRKLLCLFAWILKYFLNRYKFNILYLKTVYNKVDRVYNLNKVNIYIYKLCLCNFFFFFQFFNHQVQLKSRIINILFLLISLVRHFYSEPTSTHMPFFHSLKAQNLRFDRSSVERPKNVGVQFLVTYRAPNRQRLMPRWPVISTNGNGKLHF